LLVFVVDRFNRTRREIPASKGDSRGRERRSIEPCEAMFPELAVFRHARSNERVCDLHEYCSRCRKPAGDLSIHTPERGFRGEDGAAHFRKLYGIVSVPFAVPEKGTLEP